MSFGLPPLDASVRPEFTDSAGFQAWFAGLPPATPARTLGQATEQLALLNRTPLDPAERLALLDTLAANLAPLQQQLRPRFTGKALPLGAAEQGALTPTLTLQQGLLDGYLRCIEAGQERPSPALATAFQRALATLVDRQQDLALARQQPAAEHWQRLHRLLALAEQHGLDGQEVPVPGHSRPTTALATYGVALLIQAAGPHELSQRQLAWMLRWARRWGGKLRLGKTPPDQIQARPLCVALESSSPATALPSAGADCRYLDTGELRKSIKQRMAQLEQGRSPAELQLGEDCTQPACSQLLAHLYQRWCKGSLTRLPAAGGTVETCAVIPGLAAVHYHLNGRRTLELPATKTMEQLRREREEIATFGRVQAPPAAAASHPEFESEGSWQILQAGDSGLHLVRPVQMAGARIGSGHLLALALPGTPGLTLAQVRWLLQDSDGSLHVSLRPLPAPATPVAVRTAPQEPWRPGIQLPASATEAGSLLLPAGSFRLARVVEVQEDARAPRSCRLTGLLGKGEDHERAIYA